MKDRYYDAPLAVPVIVATRVTVIRVDLATGIATATAAHLSEGCTVERMQSIQVKLDRDLIDQLDEHIWNRAVEEGLVPKASKAADSPLPVCLPPRWLSR